MQGAIQVLGFTFTLHNKYNKYELVNCSATCANVSGLIVTIQTCVMLMSYL